MVQPRFDTFTSLLSGGLSARAGAGLYAVPLQLTVGTPAAYDAAVQALEQKRDAHALAAADLAEARAEAAAKLRACKDLLFGCRDLLKRTFGQQYSTAWAGTGFTFSLRIPRTFAGVQNVMGTLKGYLTSHPEKERADLMTAAMLETALDELEAALAAVTLKESALGTQLTARRQAEKDLYQLLRWTIEELGRKIGPTDDRWTAFGFNKPGLKATPAVPKGLTVTLVGNSAASLKWPRAARAAYYRVWLKIVGADTEPQPVGSPADLDFTIENLPANSQLEVSVSALNNGGESARSEVVTVHTAPVS